MGQRSKFRFFIRRNPKLLVGGKSNQIIVPFKPLSIILIILLILLTFYFALRSDLFQIRQLEISNSESFKDCLSEEQLSQRLDVVGRSAIFLETKKLSQDLLADVICLKSVTITTSWPNKIKINAKIRQPVAAIVASASARIDNQATAAAEVSSQEQIFLIDEEAVVIKKVATYSALPKILLLTAEQNFDVVQLPYQLIKTGVDVISALSQLQLAVNELTIDENGQLFAEIEDGVKVLFSNAADPKNQATSLQAILRQAKIDGKKLSKIDLRFTRPHVVYR